MKISGLGPFYGGFHYNNLNYRSVQSTIQESEQCSGYHKFLTLSTTIIQNSDNFILPQKNGFVAEV